MLRSTITVARLDAPLPRRTNGRTDVTRVAGGEVEVLEAARPRRGSRRDPGLLLREAARAAAERQARDRRRRHGQEAARASGDAAAAEPGQARRAGARGAGGRPRGPRPAGAGAEVRPAAAAAVARRADHAARAAAGEADRERADALGQGRGLP